MFFFVFKGCEKIVKSGDVQGVINNNNDIVACIYQQLGELYKVFHIFIAYLTTSSMFIIQIIAKKKKKKGEKKKKKEKQGWIFTDFIQKIFFIF